MFSRGEARQKYEPALVLPNLTLIPECYQDLAEAFSKQHALSLPPYQPYNCQIDLLPGASVPSCCLYNPSRPEWEAMEKYIGGWMLAFHFFL